MMKNLRAVLLGAVMVGASHICGAVGMIGLTASNQIFTMANASSPGTISSPATVSGVATGQTLVAIDYNPSNGMLYALGYASATGQAQLYTINTTNNSATAVGSAINLSLGLGGSIGFDFNPTMDNTIAIVGDNGMHYMVNATTGAVVSSGSGLSYATGDINALANASIGASTYTNSFFGSDATRQLGYDMNNNTVVWFDLNTAGQLHTTGLSGLLLSSGTGVGMDSYYDENTHSNTTYLAAHALLSTGSKLYTINANGMAATVGDIGSGNLDVKDIAVVNSRNVPASVTGTLMYGLTLNSGDLITFDSDQPQIIRDRMHITGVTSGQAIIAIDYRPADMNLYGLGYNAGTKQYQLYNINTTTGMATAVNTASTLNLGSGGNVGFDFDPVTDRIHVMGSNGLNIVLNSNGSVVANNSGAQYASNDINAGTSSDVSAVAHTNNYNGAGSSQAIGIDMATGALVNITSGTSTTLQTLSSITGLLSYNGATSNNGTLDFYFDAGTNSNTGYMVSNVAGNDNGTSNYGEFYEVNGNNYNPTPGGSVGPGVPLRDIAATPTYAGTTSVSAVAQSSNLSLFPNPAANSVTLKLEDNGTVHVTVLDISGKVVTENTYTARNNNIMLNISGLTPGVYTVKVQEEGRAVRSAKLVKHL